MKRRCDQCRNVLPGKKGHGYPVKVGKLLVCGVCLSKGRYL